MATYAPAALEEFAGQWANLFASAKFSGIVGDAQHKKEGGYHISIEDQPKDNYSVTRPDDKAPPGNWPRNLSSAVDMNLGEKDMFTVDRRVHAAFDNRANDPRTKYINAVNCWDGNGSPGRYDFVAGVIGLSTDDHTWHCHWEFKRKYANSPEAMQAALSILSGETVDEYLGEEMNDADMKKLAGYIAEALLSSDTIPVTPASGTADKWQLRSAIGDITTKAGIISRHAEAIKNAVAPTTPAKEGTKK